MPDLVSAIEIRDLGYESEDIFLWNLSRNGLNISVTVANEKIRISGPSANDLSSFTDIPCCLLSKSDLINMLWILHVQVASPVSYDLDYLSSEYYTTWDIQTWSLNKLKFYHAWTGYLHQDLCGFIKDRVLALKRFIP